MIVFLERSLNRSLYPNPINNGISGTKFFKLKDGVLKLRNITYGKLTNRDLKVIDFLTTKIRYQMNGRISRHDFWNYHETVRSRYLLVENDLRKIGSHYLMGDQDYQHTVTKMTTLPECKLTFSNHMLNKDSLFLTMFGKLKPVEIDMLFQSLTECKFKMKFDVRVFENPSKSKNTYLRPVGNFDVDLGDEVTELPSSPLINYTTKLEKGEKNIRISSGLYEITFDTYFGTLFLNNVYHQHTEQIPVRLYKLSELAQLLYRFVISMGYRRDKNGVFDPPNGLLYTSIKNRLNMKSNITDVRIYIKRALDELKQHGFIDEWVQVSKEKVRVLSNNYCMA